VKSVLKLYILSSKINIICDIQLAMYTGNAAKWEMWVDKGRKIGQ